MSEDFKKKNIIQKAIYGDKFSLPYFVQKMQGFSLGLRLTHWETTDFALHKATREIQDSIDGLLDTFVEAFVGFSDGKRPVFEKEVESCVDPDVIIECLKCMDVYDSSLLNIRDEILQSVYKFKYLKTLH